jgi:hypothetical protein
VPRKEKNAPSTIKPQLTLANQRMLWLYSGMNMCLKGTLSGVNPYTQIYHNPNNKQDNPNAIKKTPEYTSCLLFITEIW